MARGSKTGSVHQRYMGTVKYRGRPYIQAGWGGRESGLGFREARSAYAYHVNLARSAEHQHVVEGLKMARKYTHGFNARGGRSEFAMALMGAANQRVLRERGYKVLDTRMGLQIHSPSSGKNTGAGKRTKNRRG